MSARHEQAPWQPGLLLTALLVYTALSVYEPAWRVLVRGLFEGDAFEWGLGPLGGAGTSGDYPVLVAVVLAGTLLLARLERSAASLPLAPPRLALFLVAQSTALTLSSAAYVGETIGVQFAIGPVLLLIDALYLIGCIVYARGAWPGFPDSSRVERIMPHGRRRWASSRSPQGSGRRSTCGAGARGDALAGYPCGVSGTGSSWARSSRPSPYSTSSSRRVSNTR